MLFFKVNPAALARPMHNMETVGSILADKVASLEDDLAQAMLFARFDRAVCTMPLWKLLGVMNEVSMR